MKPDRKYLIGGLLFFFGFAALLLFLQAESRINSEPGRKLYGNLCSQCHGSEGKGLKELYPALENSPYLSSGLAEIPCLIRGGIKGTIVTADGSNNQRMPAFQELTVDEISQLILYLQHQWGRKNPIASVKTIEQWLSNCPRP